ncbi:AEC family transporter [Aureimonas jatrophae]|uniref:Transporter n=1 Tax=Aureimonas jatrophae TaxID=1166073 RepID=A0A1H0ID67_9HYPH|nr:AEC family transporter [Aureimonas jatrophae]MBB3952105.1 hypothetical protein [Aureimonas jatrophae]SDO29409.1 hypothetical protein SAMN05192530_10580 [Aureimonas jatrophae]
MSLVLPIVAPIFLLIALGAALGKLRLMPETTGDALTSFVFLIAVPVLLFRTVATADFGQTSPIWLWASYFAGVAPLYALGILVGARVAGLDRRGQVIAGVSASFSNLLFVGIPIVERAFGAEGLNVLSLILAVHMPTMMAASTLLLERAAALDARGSGDGTAKASPLRALRQVARNLSRSPLAVCIALGFVWRLTGWSLAGPVDEVTRLLAQTAGPLALVALGLSLPRYRIRGALAAPLTVTALTLVLQPLVVLLVGSALLPPLWLSVAVIAAASPVGVNAYLFARYFRTGESLAASTILFSTIGSAATLTLWLLAMT